jgi:prepilin-type N-terminal cleavage/methylation domain-containing protein
MKYILHRTHQAGITLIEVMVSIAIFAIVTSIVLFNYSTFNANILVTNLAYEIALAVRQAQVYGLSVKTETSSTETYAYGIYVSVDDSKNIYLYADKGGVIGFDIDDIDNCGDPDSECQEIFTIRGDVSIDSLVVDNSDVNRLDIIFKRPNPEALIYGDTDDRKQWAEIRIVSGRTGKSKAINVNITGQISVQDVN